MRIRIAHDTVYHYDSPAAGVIQVLRLTPRNHDGQYVVDWRIDVSQECRLDSHEDAFGNLTHAFTAAGPFSEARGLFSRVGSFRAPSASMKSPGFDSAMRTFPVASA